MAKNKSRAKLKETKAMIAYKFRAIPSKGQQRLFDRWFGACRFVYNCGLEERILVYQMSGGTKSLSYYDQQNQLVECKKVEELSWLRDVPSQSLQMSLRNLDRAYQNFFRRIKAGQVGQEAGFPRRKKKGRCVDSITFPQGDRLILSSLTNKKSIVTGIPKIKGGLKIIQHRLIEGKIKSATLSRNPDGKWFISFICESSAERVARDNVHRGELSPMRSIGIDLGIVKTIATDQADYSLNNDNLKKIEKQIAKYQRKMAKQAKFGDRWKKYQKIINRKHSKIARIRRDFLHKISADICKNHAIVCMENLKIKNMSKSASGTLEKPGKMVAQKSGLNRAILRQGWGMFREMVAYKTERHGGTMVLVNPKNTSQRCSICGHTELSNRETQSEFRCQKCGHNENADKNAAKNIKALGLQSLGLVDAICGEQDLEAPTKTAKAV